MDQIVVLNDKVLRASNAMWTTSMEPLQTIALAPPKFFTLQPIVGLSRGDLFGFDVAEIQNAHRAGDRSGWSPRSLAAGLAETIASDDSGMLSFVVRLDPARDEDAAAASLADGLGSRPDRRRVFLTLDLLDAPDVSQAQVRERLRRIERRGFSTGLFGVGVDPRVLACRPGLVRLSAAANRRRARGQDGGVLQTLVNAARQCSIEVLADGISDHDDLRNAVRLGAHLGQGALLGAPGPGVSMPSVTRRALVRAVSAGHAVALPPRLPEGDLDVLEEDVRFTMAALGADPDARDLLYLTAGWLARIDEARIDMRAALARVTIAEAGRHMIELRFGGVLSEAVARQEIRLDLDALDGWAVAHSQSLLEMTAAQERLATALSARRDVECDIGMRRTWLYEVLAGRAAERLVPYGWASAFFRARP